MKLVARLAERWRRVPLLVALAVTLLLFIGIAAIFQNERAYNTQKDRETHVQAEILAASVTAAVDFGDSQMAQEAVDALRVNPEVRGAGVYGGEGRLLAGYVRGDSRLPARAPRQIVPQSNLVEAIVPVAQSGQRIGTVYLASINEPLSRRLTRYLLVALLVVMGALVIVVLGIAHTALTSANRQLADRAAALATAYDELQVQVEERGKAEEQLRQAQKMQALGQLTGGIAHDFNNLLTVIQGSADMLRRPGISEEKRKRYAEAIVQTASRAAALTSQLLSFARRQPLRPEVIDLNAQIGGMADLLDRTLGERIEVRTELQPDLCAIEADPTQLEAAVLNIAVNARDAMPDGGTLTIRTEQAGTAEGASGLALSLTDSGTGMDEETMSRVFEPFFTTKAVGKGTGLGLSQVYGFAAQSGGEVRLASAPGEGTTVTLILPCTARVGSEGEKGEQFSALVRRSGTILVVDDNEEVGALAESLLTELGYQTLRAKSGDEALERFIRNPIDVVFTDVVMPGMSGLELAEALKQLRPELPIMLTTGFSDQVTSSGTGGLPVVFKPYRLDTLTLALDKLMAPPEQHGA